MLAHPQRRPQKIAQQHAHVSRPRRINARQRADRIQTVKQEVRIQLRLQRFQLRIARQHRRFQQSRFRLNRIFPREHHVVIKRRQPVERHSRRVHDRSAPGKSLVQPLQLRPERNHVNQRPRQAVPQHSNHLRSQNVRAQQSRRVRPLDWRRLARIFRRRQRELSEQAHRIRNHRGVQPFHSSY